MLESTDHLVKIPVGDLWLEGNLQVPADASGVVVFAHGSGSSRHSARNQFVARVLREGGLGTFLFDLLTREEEIAEQETRHLRFNIPLLARRVIAAVEWLGAEGSLPGELALFGASTGAAAALIAAAQMPEEVAAVVSRGGRPDLAGAALPKVKSPTLLIVGSLDSVVLELNQEAYEQLTCPRELRIIPGATHLFEEPGTLEQAAEIARNWIVKMVDRRL